MCKSVLLLSAAVLTALLGFLSPGPRVEAASNVRLGYYVGYDKTTSWPSLKSHISTLSHVSPWYGFYVSTNGTLSGTDDGTVTSFVRSHGVKIVPLVQNRARYGDFHRFITNTTYRNRAINAISNLVKARGYSGIQIDFEGLNPSDRPYLTSFMRNLYNRLHPQGKLVTMAVPAKTYDSTTGWSGAYDYAKLRPYADLFVIMAYDYHSAGSNPGPVSPLGWVRNCTRFATSELGAGKVVVGTAMYGYDWNTTTGDRAVSTKFRDILSLYNTYNLWTGYNWRSESGRAAYRKSGQNHTVWYEDARSFATKLAVARSYGAAGVAMWRLGQEDPYVWDVLRGRSLRSLGQIVDNTTSGRFRASSNWWNGTWNQQRYGSNYRYARPARVGDFARYKLRVPRNGMYEIYAWWPAGDAYSSLAPFRIRTSAGVKHRNVNQTRNGGRWVYLGTYSLSAGDNWKIEISRWTWAKGFVIADAVKIVPQ